MHVFDRAMPISPEAWTRPDYGFTADALQAQLRRHGIGHAIVSGLSISGSYNDYMIRALRAHPNLRGTAIIEAPGDFYQFERLHADGIRGIRLQLARQDRLPDLDSFEYRQLLRRVRDFGWHVQLAIEGPQLPQVIEPLLAAGVDLVFDHFGHPDPENPLACEGFAAMLRAVDTGRAWVKMSGGFRLPGTSAWRDDPDGDLETLADMVAAALVAKVGSDRLLWGSDAPFVGYESRIDYPRALASYYRWLPSESLRADVCATGMALYFDDT